MSCRIPLAALVFATTGCYQLPKDDADAAAVSFYAQGKVTSPTTGLPAVLWGVASANPGYSYQFGEVTGLSATSFIASFRGDPPDDALNSDGIGVAVVGLFQPGTSLPAGKLPDGFGAQLIGFTSQHAIIYKKPGTTPDRWWGAAFDEGWSCGRCAAPPSGESLQGYAPTLCSDLVLEAHPIDACDWN